MKILSFSSFALGNLVVDNKKKIYFFLFSLAAACAFIKNLFYAWVLNPSAFGVVALALLMANIGIYFATPGILEGLLREVPISRGKGEDVRTIRSEALTLVFILAIVVGVLLSIGIYLVTLYKPELNALLWTGPVLTATVLLNALMCDLQIREYTLEYAGVLFLKAVVPMSVLYLLPAVPDASLVLIAEVIGMIFCTTICFLNWSRDLTWRLNFDHTTRNLMKIGMPFTLSNIVQNIVMNIDRWAVQVALGVMALGAYSFVMTFSTVGLILVNMIQVYEIPRILYCYGATHDKQKVLNRVKQIAMTTALSLSVLAFPICKLLPILITRWFPQYIEINALVIWIYIGAFAISMSFFDVLFRVCASGSLLFLIQLGLIVVVSVICGLAISMKMSLVSFAMIFAVTRILNLVLGWSVGLYKLRQLNHSVERRG